MSELKIMNPYRELDACSQLILVEIGCFTPLALRIF